MKKQLKRLFLFSFYLCHSSNENHIIHVILASEKSTNFSPKIKHNLLIMKELKKKRRVFKTIERVVEKEKLFPNPLFSREIQLRKFARNDSYDEEEFLDMMYEELEKVTKSHIQHLIICQYCKCKHWVNRQDAKFCSSNCRNAAYYERKKSGNNKDPS